MPHRALPPADRERLQKANAELLAALRSRADDWASHYNLGNFLSERGELRGAANAYARAVEDAGGTPLHLPPQTDVAALTSRIDALPDTYDFGGRECWIVYLPTSPVPMTHPSPLVTVVHP